MTLADLEKIPRENLLAEEIALYLQSDADDIRWQAKHEPDKLGFPVFVIKSRVKIPKESFINICRYGPPSINVQVRTETVQYYINRAMESILENTQNETKGA